MMISQKTQGFDDFNIQDNGESSWFEAFRRSGTLRRCGKVRHWCGLTILSGLFSHYPTYSQTKIKTKNIVRM